MSKLDLGTLANVMKHADDVLTLLNAPASLAEKLRYIADHPSLVGRLEVALDGLADNLRVVKLAELDLGKDG